MQLLEKWNHLYSVKGKKERKKIEEKAFQKEICDWSSPELFNLLGIFSRWILTHVLHFAIPCDRATQHLPLVFLSRHAHNAGGNGGENYANCSEQITLTSCSSSSSIKGLPAKANLDYICQSHTLRLSHCLLVFFSPNRNISYSEVKIQSAEGSSCSKKGTSKWEFLLLFVW